MRKSVVIAGNGPSVGQIDYRRLPKEFDTFRCNLFFLEDKYYLGKEVTGFFMNSARVESLFASSSVLNIRKEYHIQNRYFPAYYGEWAKEVTARFFSLKFASKIYKSHEEILQFIDEWFNTYQKYPTTGIVAILTAVALGYKEIYITGIDFFKAKEGNVYNYTIDPKSIYVQTHTIPKTGEYLGGWHSEETDRAALELVKTFEDVKVYSLSDNTELSKLLPLAPIQNDDPYVPEEKPQGYLKDIVLSKRQQEERLRQEEQKVLSITQRIKQKFINKGLSAEWDLLQKNFLIQLVYQIIKAPYIFCKVFISIVLNVLKK